MFKSIKFGQKASSASIQRYKGTLKVKDVISVVADDIAVVEVHYVDGAGMIYSDGGRTCEEFGLPQQRYIIPIVVYKVTDWPKAYGGPISIQYLMLSQTQYENDFMTMGALSKNGIRGLDITVTCEDSNYQKLKFQPFQRNKPLWMTDPTLMEEVKKQYARYKSLIELSVARRIPDEKFDQFLERAAVNAEKYALTKGNSPQRTLSKPKAQEGRMITVGSVSNSIDDMDDGIAGLDEDDEEIEEVEELGDSSPSSMKGVDMPTPQKVDNVGLTDL